MQQGSEVLEGTDSERETHRRATDNDRKDGDKETQTYREIDIHML